MEGKTVVKIFEDLKASGRTVLLEHEVYQILESIGINTPGFSFVPNGQSYKDSGLASEEVVVKVLSPEILHKTELGAVMFCSNNEADINSTIEKIKSNTSSYKVHGFMVAEKIKYDPFFGNEMIFSVRNTDDFGTVLGFGIGGLDTEFFGKHMSNSFSVLKSGDVLGSEELKNNAAYYKLSGMDRSKKRLLSDEALKDVLNKLSRLGSEYPLISECEINPMVLSNGRLVAIDGLMKIESKKVENTAVRPTEKLTSLFHPKSIAVIGVSEKSMNMGRIILNNIINRGFSKKDIYVVKPGTEEIDGIKCIADIKSLPVKVDLFVIAVNANQSASAISDLINHNKAQSVIVIPGGFAEKEGGEKIESDIVELIQKSRKTEDKGPIIVGGNCLGVISLPGNYDTFFIPSSKMKYSEPKPYAFVSQSGAFIISKLSKTDLTPKYAVSIGNQMDLTVSDYLEFFKQRDDINLIALYVEGFKKLDGMKTAEAIEELKRKGKKVIIYKGGRSSVGKSAASGHTASIAGEYSVYRSIMKANGAKVVENFSDYEDLLKLSLHFGRFKVKSNKLAIISNAGFETVGMGDNLEDITVSKLSKSTNNKIEGILSKAKIDSLVSVSNPLDVTPVANDSIYLDCFKAMMEDESVSFGVLSCIPMTPAIKSIKEELGNGSLFNMIEDYALETSKPFVVVVDSGELFDPACRIIKNVPVFRESDRAIKALSGYLGMLN